MRGSRVTRRRLAVTAAALVVLLCGLVATSVADPTPAYGQTAPGRLIGVRPAEQPPLLPPMAAVGGAARSDAGPPAARPPGEPPAVAVLTPIGLAVAAIGAALLVAHRLRGWG